LSPCVQSITCPLQWAPTVIPPPRWATTRLISSYRFFSCPAALRAAAFWLRRERRFSVRSRAARHPRQGLELVGARRVDHNGGHAVLPRESEGHRRPQGRGVLSVFTLHEIVAHGLIDGVGAGRPGPAQSPAADDEIDLAHVDDVFLDEFPEALSAQRQLLLETCASARSAALYAIDSCTSLSKSRKKATLVDVEPTLMARMWRVFSMTTTSRLKERQARFPSTGSPTARRAGSARRGGLSP